MSKSLFAPKFIGVENSVLDFVVQDISFSDNTNEIIIGFCYIPPYLKNVNSNLVEFELDYETIEGLLKEWLSANKGLIINILDRGGNVIVKTHYGGLSDLRIFKMSLAYEEERDQDKMIAIFKYDTVEVEN